MVEYTKEQIAFIQLETAILLFEQQKYIPSITLASAAEELFTVFLQEYANENKRQIPTTAELDQGMFDMFKDQLGIKNYMAYRNNIRNELKHHGATNKKVVKGDFSIIASMYIAGAILNYKQRSGYLPNNKTVLDYCLSRGIS